MTTRITTDLDEIGRLAEACRVAETDLDDARHRRDQAIRDAVTRAPKRQIARAAGLDASRIARIIAS